MKRTTRVAIIGAGTAGLSAVSEVRKKTDDFLLINAGPYGTTCARVACMPSKALIEVANTYHRRTVFGAMGIRGAEAVAVDVPAALRRVRELRDGFVRGIIRSTEALGEKNVRGHARFLEPTVLQVDDEIVEAESVVIATGSRPIIPDAWRALGNRVFTSEEIFERVDLPRRVAVIGLGPVGLELAQAMARLGTAVTGFDTGVRIGGLTDPQVSQALADTLSGELRLLLGQPASPALVGEEVRIEVGETKVTVDEVLVAVGRRPNVQDLGLEHLGVELDDRGVPRFNPETLQVGDLPVFIAGDANGDRLILHEASDEGRIAGYGSVRKDPECFVRRCPLRITFCDPNAAVAGRPWESLDPKDIVTGSVDFKDQGRARMAGENHGILRVYASRDTGRLLGAEMAAPGGEHLAHLLAWAVEDRATVWDLLRRPFYHPVFEEGLRSALQDAARKLEGPSATELLLCESAPEDVLC